MAVDGAVHANNPGGHVSYGVDPDGRQRPLAVDAGGKAILAEAAYTATASFVPAAALYGAADIMATAQEFSFYDRNGVLVPAGSLIRILTAVVKIGVTSIPAGQTSYTLQSYGATPTGTPQADNDLWAAAAGDQAIYKGEIALGSPLDKGAFLYVKSQYIDFDIRLTGTSLFGQLVTNGGHTAAAVAREVTLHAERR